MTIPADKPHDTTPGPLSQLCDKEWQDLLDKSDRTSPAEYPDMALITRNEFGAVISEGYLLARLPAPTPAASSPMIAVCAEIRRIMATYREQNEAGNVDTPGGLEHMGDVWRMLRRWDNQLGGGIE